MNKNMLNEVANGFAEFEIRAVLEERGVSNQLIESVIDSGYWIRNYVDPFNQRTWKAISDRMYGNKGQSSNFDIEEFIDHIHGNHSFAPLPDFAKYHAKNISDIDEILDDKHRKNLIEQGLMSFRGQVKEIKGPDLES